MTPTKLGTIKEGALELSDLLNYLNSYESPLQFKKKTDEDFVFVPVKPSAGGGEVLTEAINYGWGSTSDELIDKNGEETLPQVIKIGDFRDLKNQLWVQREKIKEYVQREHDVNLDTHNKESFFRGLTTYMNSRKNVEFTQTILAEVKKDIRKKTNKLTEKMAGKVTKGRGGDKRVALGRYLSPAKTGAMNNGKTLTDYLEPIDDIHTSKSLIQFAGRLKNIHPLLTLIDGLGISEVMTLPEAEPSGYRKVTRISSSVTQKSSYIPSLSPVFEHILL